MNCCINPDCLHSYLSHRSKGNAHIHINTGTCVVAGCRCKKYKKDESSTARHRPADVPELCPGCETGNHEHHKHHRCVEICGPPPHRDYVCKCEINYDLPPPTPRRPTRRQFVEFQEW